MGLTACNTDTPHRHADNIGYDPKNGARPLRRAIEDNVESLISDSIISGELKGGDIVTIDLEKQKLKLKIGKE